MTKPSLTQAPSTDVRRETIEFVDFYREEFPAMVALASTLVGRSAEDVAQEAMIRAHSKWGSISTYDNPGTWVRRVTINLATSTLRRRATRVRKAAHLLHGIPTVTWETSLDDDLLEAVQTLSKMQRAAVVLHYLEDLPVAEISHILDCSPSTAKVHLHRGRQALAQRLNNTTNAHPAEEASL
ncbi:MAG: SigE family RNA polymerase sigma factor [Acidimicrobiia bacterium]|nr:SigE family RNA polymerase sigma factor [Acidimicrobiia bacterium]